jgi:hypothetical protein
MATDDDAARLLAKVIDRMDRVLFEHELEFKDDKDWEQFADRVRDLISEYYDDNADDAKDGDYDPDAPSSEDEDEDDDSLEEEEEEDVTPTRKRKADEI